MWDYFEKSKTRSHSEVPGFLHFRSKKNKDQFGERWIGLQINLSDKIWSCRKECKEKMEFEFQILPDAKVTQNMNNRKL